MTLDEAAARYRQAARNLATARAHSAHVRRQGNTRETTRANDLALAARAAHEHARDELVAAALTHTCP